MSTMIEEKILEEKKKKKSANIVLPPINIPSVFISRIATLAAPVNDDVMLKFSKDGITATNVDAINSSGLWIDIIIDGYEYDGDEVVVCIPINKLEKSVKGASKDDISNVSIKKGEMFVETNGLTIRIPLYSDCIGIPDVARDVADRLPSSLKMSTKDISRFITTASGEDGNLAVNMSNDTIHILLINRDTGTEDIFLTVPQSTVSNVVIPVDCESLFGTDLAFPIFTSISKISKYINIHLGDGMPMHINSNLDGFKVNYVVAPRAPMDDDE